MSRFKKAKKIVEEPKTTRTIVFKFGMLPPVEGVAEVFHQFRAAHDLRFDYTRIERGFRDQIRSVETAEMAELRERDAVLSEDIRRIDSEIRAQRQQRVAHVLDGVEKSARTRVRAPRGVVDPQLKERLDALKAERKETRERLKAATAMVAEVFPSAKPDATARKIELRKGASELSLARWGTKALVADAADQASVFWPTKTRPVPPCPLWKDGRPNNPRAPRFDGSGHVSVQIQHAATGVRGPGTVSELFEPNAEAWIDATPTWCKTNRKGEQRRKLPLLHLRIGSTGRGNKVPVFAAWPIIMHRKIPPEAKIKRITASCAKSGPRSRWSCEMTLELPVDWASERPTGSGSIAVRLGWSRAKDGSIVVGTWADTSGRTGVVLVDAGPLVGGKDHLRRTRGQLAERISYPSALRSIRDSNFDAARDALAAWIKTNDVPEWMRERAKWISHWKAPRKLAALVSFWARNRFGGDEEAFGFRARYDGSRLVADGSGAEGWRYHDRHLWEWEEAQRSRALGARREVYRRFAAWASRTYAEIVVDDTDMSALARRPRAADDGDNRKASALRTVAAPSELRDALRNAASMRGVKLTEVSAENIARTCPACGACSPEHKHDDGVFLCLECGHEENVSLVVAHNQLSRAGHSAAVRQFIERQKEVARGIRRAWDEEFAAGAVSDAAE